MVRSLPSAAKAAPAWKGPRFLVLSIVILVAACTGVGEPVATHISDLVSPVPAATAAAAATIPSAGPAAVTDTLRGGRYLFQISVDSRPVKLVATGPRGWVGYPSWAMDGPEPIRADAPGGIGIAFFAANGLFSDPCHWDVRGTGKSGSPGDVLVGPTVTDLVAALRTNTFYSASAPRPVAIDGYAGQELELQLPDDPFTSCDKDDPSDPGGQAFVFSGPGLYAQGPANRWHLYILDVDGARVIAVVLSYKGTSRADLQTAQDVIDTLDIVP